MYNDLTLWRVNVSNSAILYPKEPSPYIIHTSQSGRHNLAPNANPPPTPSVPNAPGSSQCKGALGLQWKILIKQKKKHSFNPKLNKLFVSHHAYVSHINTAFRILNSELVLCNDQYSEICLNWTFLGPTFVFGIDSCSVFTG